jgi:hypothetical protein
VREGQRVGFILLTEDEKGTAKGKPVEEKEGGGVVIYIS